MSGSNLFGRRYFCLLTFIFTSYLIHTNFDLPVRTYIITYCMEIVYIFHFYLNSRALCCPNNFITHDQNFKLNYAEIITHSICLNECNFINRILQTFCRNQFVSFLYLLASSSTKCIIYRPVNTCEYRYNICRTIDCTKP